MIPLVRDFNLHYSISISLHVHVSPYMYMYLRHMIPLVRDFNLHYVRDSFAAEPPSDIFQGREDYAKLLEATLSLCEACTIEEPPMMMPRPLGPVGSQEEEAEVACVLDPKPNPNPNPDWRSLASWILNRTLTPTLIGGLLRLGS